MADLLLYYSEKCNKINAIYCVFVRLLSWQVILMKKNKRLGVLIEEFTANPSVLFDSKHFCDKFDIAKSSLSEDIKLIDEIFRENGSGRIESIPGVGGGIRYIPDISDERIEELQEEMCRLLSDPSRILGGGFLYTSDILYDGKLMNDAARFFAGRYSGLNADYVVTVETKGIPLAAQTARLLNIPLVVIRREAMYSEGSTVSINYFSGSSDRIQKMSLAKRAVKPGSKAIVIDDFMRGGGSAKGIIEVLSEFDVETLAIGVAIAAIKPEKKKITDYTAIVILEDIDEDERIIKLKANKDILNEEGF